MPDRSRPECTADTRDDAPATHADIDLDLAVVEYATGPDRATIHPGVCGHDRTTHWLSADRSVFCDLAMWR
ncbi:DUF7511 domain-containing protein [Halococcoides cellulosivorans]|uniref:DUF7511 domain-containing protein n=1 Tax=Halococcoides cellulosivorans TaxID=1679096 RepID=A0A2R4X381_9EURY|nr:hypothetical protein [Halococcoides cellulosivorans]AWB28260.1 hypothetical protein HARCEL1_11380 [Halococcoides cellulosivorans]